MNYDDPHQTKKGSVADLCRDAIEHYEEISNEAMHSKSIIPHAIRVYQRVQEYYDALKADWDKQTWQKGFDTYTHNELEQLEEFLGYE